MKQVAKRQENNTVTDAEIEVFNKAKALLSTVMQRNIYFIKSEVQSSHSDERAWINFIEETTAGKFEEWKTEYLTK